MKRTLRNVLYASVLLSPALHADGLEDLWQQSRSRAFIAPSIAELAQAERLFLQTLADRNGAELRAAWAALGFALVTIAAGEQTFAVLHEQPEQRRGRGFFAFAPARERPLVLQAPHSFSDQHTGTIGFQLFREGDFRAAAWNTAARRYADWTQHEASYLLPFTRAAARYDAANIILQLHGFAAENRSTETAKSAGFIVSSGAEYPAPAALSLRRCLAAQFSDAPAYLYPDEVSELGGTRNLVGQTLRAAGSRGFIHLEMSAPVRAQLLHSRASRKRLLSCFAQGER